MKDIYKIMDELKDIAIKKNICVVTATQPPSPKRNYIHNEINIPKNTGIVFIDYLNLINPRKKING